jgi:hypothetical protein
MKQKPINCILKANGGILCKDKRFRSFVNFGNPSFTCKFFKSKGWARRCAEKMRLKEWEIILLYSGDSIDATGNITRARNIQGLLGVSRSINV